MSQAYVIHKCIYKYRVNRPLDDSILYYKQYITEREREREREKGSFLVFQVCLRAGFKSVSCA